jgi:hypothetical protein
MRKFIAGAVLAVGVVSIGGTAFAGEINGSGDHGNPDKGNQTPVAGWQAGSICAFSGLEDGSEEGSTYGPGNVQNWGTIPREVRDMLATMGEHPGDACRGFASGGED